MADSGTRPVGTSRKGRGRTPLLWARKVRDFARSAFDLIACRPLPRDRRLLRTELFSWHRARQRDFVGRAFAKGGTGIELGVFCGLFSSRLLHTARPRTAYFVDLWWEGFGETYPDWGRYTDFGRLPTRLAHAQACKRIERARGDAVTHVVVGDAIDFLGTLPDGHLDWAYLDTRHEYAENLAIVRTLLPKMKTAGIIAGDDWCDDPAHHHYAGTTALYELIELGEIELIEAPRHAQWLARRPIRTEA